MVFSLAPAAQGKMIADTLVIYAAINRIGGSNANEGAILYNPTPNNVSLNNYRIEGGDEGNWFNFTGSHDTVPAFGFFFVADGPSATGFADTTSNDAISSTTSDSLALYLGSAAGTANIVDYWDLGIGGTFYAGDKRETSPKTFDDTVWIFRTPAVMTNYLTTTASDSPLMGGGGMINRLGTNDIFVDSRVTSNIDSSGFVNRRSGWVDRMKFNCVAPSSVSQGQAFSLSCTAIVNFGKRSGSSWEATDYNDSIVRVYDGSRAWGDIAITGGATLSGLSVDSTFDSGVLNNYSLTASGASGNLVLTISDAQCTGYVNISVTSGYGAAITVDGDSSEWGGTRNPTVHDTTISNGVFIYSGVSSDVRTDGVDPDSNYDLTEIRFTGDTRQLYVLISMNDITDVAYPHVSIAIDTDQRSGDGSMNWVGPDDNMSIGGVDVNYSELNLSLHVATGSDDKLEFYRDISGSWFNPTGAGDSITISAANNVIEASFNWGDVMNLTSVVGALPRRLKFMVGSYDNNVDWNNNGNATNDIAASPDGLDVMTPYCTNGDNAWWRDIADSDFDSYVFINFNKNGLVNHYPDTPNLDTPVNGYVLDNTLIRFQWYGNDIDSMAAKDSAMQLQIGLSSGATDFLDTKVQGWDGDILYSCTPGRTYFWRVRSADDFGTSPFTTDRSFTIPDTIDIVRPTSLLNDTHETSVATITVTGFSWGGTTADSVQITVSHGDTVSNTHSSAQVWSVGSVVLQDIGPETIIARLFIGGVQKANDTIIAIYDSTPPRITKSVDTNTIIDGASVANTDTYVSFYLIDTGVGMTSSGASTSCTLSWHLEGSPGFDTVKATVKHDRSGTHVIEALLPLSQFTKDTTIGFWWTCRDDVGNGTSSIVSSLSPAYSANQPGTFTVLGRSVRDVVISEIMWHGDDSEYIELYNTTSRDISLNGWTLRDYNGGGATGFTATFGLSDTVPAYGYHLVLQGRGGSGVPGVTNLMNVAYAGIDTSEFDDFDDNDLNAGGDSLSLKDQNGVEIDSAPWSSGWPAGGPAGGNQPKMLDTGGVSMERILSGDNFKSAGPGDSEGQWDTHHMSYGYFGRPNGTPGRANSINSPRTTTFTPVNPVAAGGRGKWIVTVTNGRQDFTSGRLVMKPPAGWTSPQGTGGSPGYTSVSISNGSGSTTYDGDSVIVDLTTWSALTGSVQFTYGDVSGGRNGLATAQSAVGSRASEFEFFYDTQGTAITRLGDSMTLFSVRDETVPIVEYDAANLAGGSMETNPANNPTSFLGSEYVFTHTLKDSFARPIYGAHDSISMRAFLTTNTAAADSHVHEDGSWSGNYEPTANDSTQVGGWTDENGQFRAEVHTSNISGVDNQLNRYRVSWGYKGAATNYDDSGRRPVPIINEVGWDGTTDEFVEVYNPTDSEYHISNFKILASTTGKNAAGVEVAASDFNLLGIIPPKSYVVFVDGTSFQDSGTPLSRVVTLGLTDGAPGETIFIQSNLGDTIEFGATDNTTGEFFNDANADGTPDSGIRSSLERRFSNRNASDTSSWWESDSVTTYPGGRGLGTPGRPNSRSLYATEVDRYDSFIGKSLSLNTKFDTARVQLVLMIASGDTQPNQMIGCTVAMDLSTLHGDSNFLVTFDSSTNGQGTTVIQISSNSNNVSGTVTLRIKQPRGITDSAQVVFDRGDSIFQIFQSSDTRITDTYASNAIVAFVGFADTFSGLDSTIMPQFRWKFGTGGTWSTLANMAHFNADTYLARIDIAPNTYALKSNDTIYWQYVWRDKAGNWETSANNYSVTSEYIDNTKAFDTIVSPTGADTLSGSGSGSAFQITIGDAANNYCTVVIRYDTYTSNVWKPITLVSGYDTLNSILTTTAGVTNTYRWNTTTDLPDTGIASVRLRFEIYDGFDTKLDTTSYFGVDNRLPDTPQILLPMTADFQNTTAVQIRWKFNSLVAGDSQKTWEINVDTGPNPDWAQMADSQSGRGADTDVNETRTIALRGGDRYHVRVRLWNSVSNISPYSEDTWFWVGKRVMDGFGGDWIGTAGGESDAAYISGGEWIWMDRVNDQRTDSANSTDMDLQEMRVTSDSYFFYFMFRMQAMAATSRPLFTIGIDSDRSPADTYLNWIGSSTTSGGSTSMGQGGLHNNEFAVDYGLLGSDSPIWMYRDTGTGAIWERINRLSFEYLRDGEKIGEVAIPKMVLRPVMTGDTLRLTIGIAHNSSNDPNTGDRTSDYVTTDHVDDVFPGAGYASASAWVEDLSDGDIDFYIDLSFKDTGDVSSNSAPSAPVTPIPADFSETSAERFVFRWAPSTDADAKDTVTYWFKIDDDSAFGSILDSSSIVRGGETFTMTKGLQGFKTYYWMVRARDNHGVYGAWSDTFEFTTKVYPDTPPIIYPQMGDFANTTTVQIRWRYKSPLADDTQTAWLIQIDTGPEPDWAQLTDSQSRSGIINETRTVALTAGRRYHARVRTYNDSGPSDWSADTWFWVPKRIMDGFSNDWVGTPGTESNAGYISGGEYIWMDSAADERTDPAGSDADFDLTEFRVSSDSYFFFFLFRMSDMSATTRPLFTISIDTDRRLADTILNWLGDDASPQQGRPDQYGEFNIDYGILTADSPIWIYRDTATGAGWVRENSVSIEYLRASEKLGEMAIPKSFLKPILVGDTIRLTVAVAQNADADPSSGDRTTDFTTTDLLDGLFPGARRASWDDDLADGDIDYFVDVFFTDTGEVRSNNPPSVAAVTAVMPAHNSETSASNFWLRWTPATDTDAGDTVTYWFRLDGDSKFLSPDSYVYVVYDAETVPMSYSMTNNTTYYWQVRARDNHGVYTVWSDTFAFTYRRPGKIDGADDDWIGTSPIMIAHDTVISSGEFIYQGVIGDERTDGPADADVDIKEVRFTGDSNYLYVLVRMQDITTTDEVHIGIGVDIDQNTGDAAQTWGVTDEVTGGTILKPVAYTETTIAIHNPIAGNTRIELFSEGGTAWHPPTGSLGSADSSFISAGNNLLEAAIPWDNFKPASLPQKFNFTVASYDNVVGWNDTVDATGDYFAEDALDNVRPYSKDNCVACPASWDWDLSNTVAPNYDSYLTVAFNKTGKVNHYPDTPTPTFADSAVIGETLSTISLTWTHNDVDSADAKDSRVNILVSTDGSFSTLVLDTRIYGFATSFTFNCTGGPKWYYWKVRHADDFGTSPFTNYRAFKLNTLPTTVITAPAEGETLGSLRAISYYVSDSTGVRDTVTSFQYSIDSGTNWFNISQRAGDTLNLAGTLSNALFGCTWNVYRNLFDTTENKFKLMIRIAVSDGLDTAWDTVTNLNYNTVIDTGRTTLFVSDRGDSSYPHYSDSVGAILDIARAIDLLNPANGADTVVIFQRIASDSYRLTTAIAPDSGMTILGFKEWNRRKNGNNSDTAGAVDTYAKIANSANTPVIDVEGIDNVTIAGLILEGDSAGGALHDGIWLNNSSVDSISLIHMYRLKTGLHLSLAESNVVSGVLAGKNLNEGIRIDSASQNNRILANFMTGNDSAGIALHNPFTSSNRLQENTIQSGKHGVNIQANGNVIVDNIISSNNATGVNLDSAAFNRIMGNYISANSETGIQFINNSQGNYVAMNFIDANIKAGIGFAAAGTNHTDTVEANVITRNDTAISAAEGAVFDVRYNWFNQRNEDAVQDSVILTGTGSRPTVIPFALWPVDTTAGADTVAPDSTQIRTDSITTSSSVTIKWDTVTTDRDGTALNGFGGFHIYRTTADTANWFGQMLDTVLPGGGVDTRYVDATVSYGVTYYYRVTAFDSHYTNGILYFNESWFSDTRVVSTPGLPFDTIMAPADSGIYGRDVTVTLFLLNPDSSSCTVAIQYTTDLGTTWRPATISGDLTDLYAPMFGDTKSVTWQTLTDLPDTQNNKVMLRMAPWDGTETGPADTTANFTIDNVAPVITSLTFAANRAQNIYPRGSRADTSVLQDTMYFNNYAAAALTCTFTVTISETNILRFVGSSAYGDSGIDTVSGDGWTCTYTIAGSSADGDSVVILTFFDTPGNSDSVTINLRQDVVGPSFSNVKTSADVPADYFDTDADSEVYLTWSVTDAGAGVDTVWADIRLSTPTSIAITDTYDTDIGHYGKNTYYVSAADSVDNTTSASSDTIFLLLTHDDYNDSSDTNDWNGMTGPFTGGGGTIQFNRTAGAAQEGARSLEMTYDVSGTTGDYSGYYSKLNNANFTDTKWSRAISFWVQGLTGSEVFKVELGESSALVQKVPIRDYINGGIPVGTWREINIPVMAYDLFNINNPYWTNNLAFVFEYDQGNPRTGTVRIDNIRIVEEPETYQVDSWDDPDTGKSSFNGSMVYFESSSDINAQRDTTTYVGDTGGSLRVWYGVTGTGSGNYVVIEQTLNNTIGKGQDVRFMKSLHFWTKLDTGTRGALANVWLLDMAATAVKQDLETFLPAIPTDTWVPVNIPLITFNGMDTASTKMIKWAWEYEDKSGTMWIDNVEFSKGYNMTAPVAPTIVSPSSDSVIQDTAPTFRWNSVSDAQGVNYFIQVAAYLDTDFSDPIFSATTNNTSKQFAQTLDNGGRYRWRLAAYDNHGNWSKFTDSYAFKIQQNPFDDFNDSSSLNRWGGSTDRFTGGGGSASVNRITTDKQEGARSMEIIYDVSGTSGDYAGYYSVLNNSNFTDTPRFRALSFWAKGLTGAEQFDIEMGESSVLTQQVPIRDYVNGAFPTGWKEINIPLSVFDQMNFKDPWWNRNFALTFEYDQGPPRTGTVMIDNVRFVTEPETYIVDSYDHSDTGKSSFNGSMVYFENSSDINAQRDTTTFVGDTGGSLRVWYNVTGSGSGNYVVIEQTLNNTLALGQDVRWMTSLHFWAKADSVPRGPIANVWLLDMGNNSALQDLERYVPALTDTWVPVNIPMKAFTGADSSSLKMIKWAWEYEDKSGTTWLDAIEFSKVYDLTPPNTPTLSIPGAGVVVTDSTPTFTWTGGSDAQGESYWIQVTNFADSDFSDPVISRITPALSLAFAQPLKGGVKYHWRVAAYDGHGNWTGFSDTRAFTVFDDAGRTTVFVSDRGDSSNPTAQDSSGAFGGILEAISALTPANGPDTIVIFQSIAADSYRMTMSVIPDSGMTILGFKEWNRRKNGNNSDTAGGADTYAKIATSVNTPVIHVLNIDNVEIAGLILDGDSSGGSSHHGIYLDNSSNDSISLVQVYRAIAGIRLSGSETNIITSSILSKNNEGILLVSSSQNNTIIGDTFVQNDSTGLSMQGGSSNILVKSNAIVGGNNGIHAASASNNLIGNTISGNRGFGVQFDGGTVNRLMSNRILNSGNYGVYVVNSAQGNYVALNDIDSGFGAGIYFSGTGTNHTDTFEGNNISRCDTNVLNAEGATFDLRYNWWSGLRNEEAVTDSAVNTGGSGLTVIPYSLWIIDTSAGADTVSPDSTRISADSTVAATSVTISWDTVTTDRDATALNGFGGFHIYRTAGADTSDWFSRMIDTVLPGGGFDTQYTDNNVSAVTTYYYRVTSFDSHYTSGILYFNESWFSDTRAVSTPVANKPPQDTILLPSDGETYAAEIPIRFTISDPDSNYCTVAIQFSVNGGGTWTHATLSGTSTIGSLYSPTFSDTKLVIWRSKTQVADTQVMAARVRVIPNDGTETGIEDTTLRFGVDNEKPGILTCTATADVSGAETGVYLFWNTSGAADSQGYYIYRSATTDSLTSSRISNLVRRDTFGYLDTTVGQGDTKYYYVVAVDSYLNESDSSRLEAAPNVVIAKSISDSSNSKVTRPGDTLVYQITVRNNGFAPADGVEVFDYEPGNTDFSDSATASSVNSSWTIRYRVSGASGADVWQVPLTDTATMIRFTRANRMDPNVLTPSDTLTVKVKVR